MKKIIVILAAGLLAQQIIQAQGTLYLSNLGQPSTGSLAVGSNAWYAADFITGTNAGGYILNSVNLAMTDATSNPSGFTALIYSAVALSSVNPGSNLETLNGSANPAANGIYTYTDSSNLILSPNTGYFIVLTSGTAITNGAYQWIITSTPSSGYNSYHWGGGNLFLHSNNGSSWSFTSGTYGQFAIDATAVPEPSSLGLLVLGGLGFFWHRRETKVV